MTPDNFDLLGQLVQAAEAAATRRANPEQAKRDARDAGIASFSALFGEKPPASEPAPTPADDHRAEVEAIRADLEALTSGEAPQETDAPSAPAPAADEGEAPAPAAESAPKPPATGSAEGDAAALQALFGDS